MMQALPDAVAVRRADGDLVARGQVSAARGAPGMSGGCGGGFLGRSSRAGGCFGGCFGTPCAARGGAW